MHSSSDENALSDLAPAEREHYLAWWRKFKMLDLLNWLGIGVGFGGYFGHRYYASGSWERIAIAGFALVLVTRVWMRALICPRCGATFSGGLITVIKRFSFLDKCYGCDLSRRELAALERRGY